MSTNSGIFQKIGIAAAFAGSVGLSGCTGSPTSDARAAQRFFLDNTGTPPCMADPVMPASPNGVAGRVQQMEDDRMIQQLKAQYGNALDEVVRDPSQVDNLVNLFTDDLCVDYDFFGRFHNKTDLRNFFQNIVPSVSAWTFHVVSHPIININNDEASATWRVIVHGVSKDNYGAGAQPSFARYKDRYVKTNAGWKLRTSIVSFDIPPTGP